MNNQENKHFWKEYGFHVGMLAIGLFATLLGGDYLLDSLEQAKNMDSCQTITKDVSQWLCAIKLYTDTALSYGDTNSRLWIDPVVTTLGVVMSGFATRNMFTAAIEHFQKK
jgi:hypothetical protein